MLIKYTETELRTALHKEIAALLAKRAPVHPAWVTHTICNQHRTGLAYQNGQDDGTIEPEAVAFWRFCGYTYTRKIATACINELDADATDQENDTEPFLPGFKFVRPQYVVRRDGVDVMVPTEQMTVPELQAKADLFDRNSATLAEHARELRRYAAMREHEAAS